MIGEIQKFKVYDVSDDCLQTLTADQRAMFAILCLTLSEIEAMRKVVSLGPSLPIGDDDLDTALISQKQVFFRLIAMKLFEVFKTLRLSGDENRSEDTELNSFRNEIVLREYNKLKKLGGYEKFRVQRNKLGFHYDLGKFRELGALEDSETSHVALVSEDLEFQSFPFGEILVTAELGGENGSYSEKRARDNLAKQTEFISEAIHCFTEVFQAFFSKFLEDKLEQREEVKALPDLVIAQRGKSPFPLILIPEGK